MRAYPVAIALLAAACGLSVTGTAPESTPPDAGTSSSSSSSSSSSGVPVDSGVDAGPSCAAIVPPPTHCWDFDTAPSNQGTKYGFASMIVKASSPTVALADSPVPGGKKALSIKVDDTNGGDHGVDGELDLGFPGKTHFIIEADVVIDAMMMQFADLIGVSIEGGSCGYPLALSTSGSALKLTAESEIAALDVPEFAVGVPFHLKLDFTLPPNAMSTELWSINGKLKETRTRKISASCTNVYLKVGDFYTSQFMKEKIAIRYDQIFVNAQ
jgi:hypothetical protein